MPKSLIITLVIAVLLATGLYYRNAAAPESASTQEPARVSGVNLNALDPATRPQDDFYRYVNGGWLDRTEIPGDESNYGSFSQLADKAREQRRQRRQLNQLPAAM